MNSQKFQALDKDFFQTGWNGIRIHFRAITDVWNHWHLDPNRRSTLSMKSTITDSSTSQKLIPYRLAVLVNNLEKKTLKSRQCHIPNQVEWHENPFQSPYRRLEFVTFGTQQTVYMIQQFSSHRRLQIMEMDALQTNHCLENLHLLSNNIRGLFKGGGMGHGPILL